MSPVRQASKLPQDQRGRQGELGTREPVKVQQFTTSSTSAVEGKKHKLTADGSKVGFLTEQEQAECQPATGRRAAGNRQAILVVGTRRLVDLPGLRCEAKVGGKSGRNQVISPEKSAGESGMRVKTIWQRVSGVKLHIYWLDWRW